MGRSIGVTALLLVTLSSTFASRGHYRWSNNASFQSQELAEYQSDWRNVSAERESKFFPLFTLVRFSNEPCRTVNEENGVCYTRPQCSALGGLAAGTCATGLGVCCQFFSTCGSIVNQNQTFFRNPDYPNKYRPPTGSDICQIRIRRQINTCQLRLNFLKFDLDGPSIAQMQATGGGATIGVEAGFCKNDMFTVTAPGAPPVCGNMDGQHMYFDFGSADTITLNVLLSANADRDREWNIELLMIPCRAQVRAPSGCLQYFQGVTGQINSFNFMGGQHLANLAYSSCIRVEEGMRSIEWSACNPGDVKISGPTPLPAQTNPGPGPAACSMINVVDYITIPGGVVTPPFTGTGNYPVLVGPAQSFTDRFCDIFFGYSNTVVRTNVKPFMLGVRTDGLELPPIQGGGSYNDASGGFCFRWQQSPNNI